MLQLHRSHNWHVERVNSISFSPDGSELALGRGWPIVRPDRVEVWGIPSVSILRELPQYPNPIHAVGYSPDGTWIAYAGGGGSVVIWEARTAKIVAQLSGPNDMIGQLCFSADSRCIAAAARTSQNVYIWDIEKQKLAATLAGHTPYAACMAMSRSGEIAVGSLEKLHLWARIDGKWESTVIKTGPRKVDGVCYVDRDSLIAFCTLADLYCLKLSTKQIRRISHLDVGGFKSVCAIPSRNLVATCGFADSEDDITGAVSVWDCSTKKCIHTATGGKGVEVNLVSAPDTAPYLATYDTKANVTIWSIEERPAMPASHVRQSRRRN